jgi:hypothetical protein
VSEVSRRIHGRDKNLTFVQERLLPRVTEPFPLLLVASAVAIILEFWGEADDAYMATRRGAVSRSAHSEMFAANRLDGNSFRPSK